MVSATMVVATGPVSDLARAKVFYGETLGLTFLWENPASVRFRCGDDSELSIFRRPSTVTEHTVAHYESVKHDVSEDRMILARLEE
jgi:catechol 2,3-dioxygenase-like lactoylglutathione lyase family enzyme